MSGNNDDYEGHAPDDQPVETTTGALLDNMANLRTGRAPLAPARGEPDPRPVDALDEQIALLGPTIDGLIDAWAPRGSHIGALADDLRWGIVNTLLRQSQETHHDMHRSARELKDLASITSSNEIHSQNLLEHAETTQTLYDRVGAFERLHEAATYHYRQRTGTAWRPNTRRSYVGSQVNFSGSYSTGIANALAVRNARREREQAQAEAEQRTERIAGARATETQRAAEATRRAATAEPRDPTYAGIGSRSAPEPVQRLMNQTAQILALNGFTLRSGAAAGSDQAFEDGADAVEGPKEIFLPEEGFNGRFTDDDGLTADISDRAYEIAAQFHPNWNGLQDGVKRLHARNSHQVLGDDCDSPVDIVVCWTPNGQDVGGTSQALRIARDRGIPIINLGAPDAPRSADQVFARIQQTIAPWRQSTEQAAESTTAERQALAGPRIPYPDSAYHVVVVGDQGYGEPDPEAAAGLDAIEDRIRIVRADPNLSPADVTARIAELRNEARTIDAAASDCLQHVSHSLGLLHRKYPNLVVNTLHGSDIGRFATEWAQLNGVPHQSIGTPKAGDLIDLDYATIPYRREGESDTVGLPLIAIARRQRAILELAPRVLLAFGEDRYATGAYRQLAAEHGLALWSFDRDGSSTTHAAGTAPSLDEPPRTRLPIYAGIGATNAPAATRELMTEIAMHLASEDFLLRSGAGAGSDEAFETGAALHDGRRRIYLATDGYRGRTSGVDSATAQIPERAFQVAKEHLAGWHDMTGAEQRAYTREHFYERTAGDPPDADIAIPDHAFEAAKDRLAGWDKLTENTQRQYARAALELLGDNLKSPADVLVCWTRGGNSTGVTGFAQRLAATHAIPVINLGAAGAPTTVDAFTEQLHETIRPWGEAVDRAYQQSSAAIAPNQIENDLDEYRPQDRELFRHNTETLAFSHEHFDRFLEVLAPAGTQLSDYRARLAWGVVNVLDYQVHDLTKLANSKDAPKPGTPERATLDRHLAELTELYKNASHHYSAHLGYGPFNPLRRRNRVRTQTWSDVQANAVLRQIEGDTLAAHRPENARVIVEGAATLNTMSDYERLDRFLTRLRDWHRDHEGRDISIIHKSTRPDLLRSWCENNGVHHVVYTPQYHLYDKRAPAMRDRDMVNNPPADRYVGIQHPDTTLYTERHVREYNENAARSSRAPIRLTLVDPAKATATQATPSQGPRQQAAAPPPENNVTPLPAANAPIHFWSRANEGTVLSNPAPARFTIDNVEWHSVEQYYQAEKLGAVRLPPAEKVWQDIRRTTSPAELRQLGRSLPAVKDWEERKVGVMAEALCAKFAPGTEAAEYLLSTGDRPLLHATPWGQNGDTTWGTGRDGTGDNILGAMIESCRDTLRAGRAPEIDALLSNVPDGYFLGEPATSRVSDLADALDLYSQSYQNWTQSYRGNEAQVSEAHSATTAELGQAIGRAATFFNANYDRYEEPLGDMEIPRETLEARARTVAVDTSHDRTQAQDHHIGALRA